MNKIEHGIVTSLAGLALLAAATGIGLNLHNGRLRAELGQGQQYVQQSVQLEGLYREMVRALAELSARHSDEALRSLLQRHGITYNLSAAPAANAAAVPARKP